MNARLLAVLALMALASLPGESSAQRGFRIPSGGGSSRGGSYFFPVIFPSGGDSGGVVAVVVVLVIVGIVIACIVSAMQPTTSPDAQPSSPSASKSTARVRITATPPGEAPADVRRAWVGLELPLTGDGKAVWASGAAGVLSRRKDGAVWGYVVEGKTAIDLLAVHAPDAASWWRRNVPGVMDPDYRLVFPTEACVLLPESAPTAAAQG